MQATGQLRHFLSRGRTHVSQKSELYLPLAIGMALFFVLVGPRVLDPTNVGWLGRGDPLVHYLGWSFFRHGDWTFPLGLNPGYGMNFSSGIIFSDSNPLFAFLFKIFNPILPETFQYFGYWMLLCCMLQALFGYKLMKLATDDRLSALLGSAIFVVSPIMLQRFTGHFSLGGHFVILAALYFALHPNLKRRRVSWFVLLALCVLIHPYLLVMVAAVWAADLVTELWKKRLPFTEGGVEFAIALSVIVIVAWQAGYFASSTSAAGGFGKYRASPLALIDPNHWSRILPNIPGKPGEGEGFGYPGLGVILLSFAALASFALTKQARKIELAPLAILGVAIAGLFVFALSNKVSVVGYEFSYPLPSWTEKLTGTFRASGRMVWPLVYLVTFAVLAIIVSRFRRSAAVALLSLGLVAQFVDSKPGRHHLKNRTMADYGESIAEPLVDPFWEMASERYTALRLLPPALKSTTPEWSVLANYASLNQMPTDAVFMARPKSDEFNSYTAKAMADLNSGNLDPQTLYILHPRTVPTALIAIAGSEHKVLVADDIYALAPGWGSCVECQDLGTGLALGDAIEPVKLGHTYLMNTSGDGIDFLATGWSINEKWGTWSLGPSSSLVLVVPREASQIEFDANFFLTAKHSSQRVRVQIGPDQAVQEFVFTKAQDKLVLDVAPVHSSVLVIKFELPDNASPKQLGLSEGTRNLALGLKSVTVR